MSSSLSSSLSSAGNARAGGGCAGAAPPPGFNRPAMAPSSWRTRPACCDCHSATVLSSSSEACTMMSTPESSTSMRAGVSSSRRSWAAMKASSIACATWTTTSRPTMAAAPLIEWAARISDSVVPASPAPRSSSSRPSVRVWVCPAASSRNRSIIENWDRSL